MPDLCRRSAWALCVSEQDSRWRGWSPRDSGCCSQHYRERRGGLTRPVASSVVEHWKPCPTPVCYACLDELYAVLFRSPCPDCLYAFNVSELLAVSQGGLDLNIDMSALDIVTSEEFAQQQVFGQKWMVQAVPKILPDVKPNRVLSLAEYRRRLANIVG